MTTDLQSVLEDLAALVGETPDDLETDHGRWQLYDRAIDSSVGADLLLQAVKLEDDKILATSVVVRMLELVTDEQQATWIEQLPPDHQAYSQKRGKEIRILRRARSGVLAAAELGSELDGWSDWLQLRLAGALRDHESLTVLSIQGRTKRIRNVATEQLKVPKIVRGDA